MICWRCHKKLRPNDVNFLCLEVGIKVPVCKDDRMCYSYPQKCKKKRRKRNENKNRRKRKRRKNNSFPM